MTYTTISHCGNDHQVWLKSMDFYDDELDILEGRLLEIVRKNNTHEAMAGVEHFQNQFIIQRNNIDELKHNIKEHTVKVAADAQRHAGKIETGLLGEHNGIKEQFEIFEKLIKELRHEFNLYLSKWM